MASNSLYKHTWFSEKSQPPPFFSAKKAAGGSILSHGLRLPGGLDFVEKASQLCTVSIAHTTADYNQAKAAFDKGVTHATHLFNAMSGLHHRGIENLWLESKDCEEIDETSSLTS